MCNLILQIMGILGVDFSFLGLGISMNADWSLKFDNIWFIVFLLIMGCSILVVAMAVNQYLVCKPKIFKEKVKINEYMYKWIENGGRVAICTRDMSWGNSAKMKDLLISKSREKELCICLPEHTALTLDLENAGADVYTYKELEHIPTARFTIIHKDTDYARVAVGRTMEDHVHQIQEFSMGNSPVFSIANDLIDMIKKYNEKGRRF